MWLSDLSIKRPVFIVMVVLALVVMGVISYTRMGVDLLPDVTFPLVAVQVVYPGAGPQEVESQVSKPLEEALGSLSGLKTLSSTSSEGLSQVIMEFQLDYPISRAEADVRERVFALTATLPQEIMTPVILRFDPAMLPVLSFSVTDKTGSLSPAALRRLVQDKIKPRIERLEGVAQVEVTGGLEREIHVDLSLERLQALKISPQQVVSAIKMENLNIPAGRLTQGSQELLLRVPGDFQRVADIAQVVIANRGSVPTRVQDVASVTDSFKEVRTFNRTDGKDALFLSVRKQSGTNTVQVVDRVRQEHTRLIHDYPELDIAVATDQSTFINQAVDDTIRDIIIGALLAAVVVFLFFLNPRNTLITVIGLPVILVAAFWAVALFGFTINMMVLLALALGIGLLIDDAIVVRENIFRHIEEGEEPKVAASQATKEIALTVLAMTLTIVSVFLPVAFASGIVGKFLWQFGITVSAAVLISLFEAFTLGPMLAAYFLRRNTAPRNKQGLRRRRGIFDGLREGYRATLGWSLSHRVIIIILTVFFFFGSLAVVPFVGQAFVQEFDQGEFPMTLELSPGTALVQTDSAAKEVETWLFAQPEVKHVFTRVGGFAPEVANFSIQLKGMGQVKPMQGRLRQRYSGRWTVNFGSGGMFGGIEQPIQVNVRSSGSLEELDTASQQVLEVVRRVPGAVDVDRSLKPGKPELRIEVDRKRSADLGLTVAQIGTTVRTLVSGEVASQFREGDETSDILVRLRDEDKRHYGNVLSLNVLTPRGTAVPLSTVTRVLPATGPTKIERQDRQRQISIGASYLGRPQGDVVADIQAGLAKLKLPAGVITAFGGETQVMQESFGILYFTLALSVVFIYMVLASLFSSFLQPFIIMLALPLSVIGAFFALLLTHKQMDITAMIGIILLMGIVTKNSIMLVDFTNAQRRQGRSIREALLTAGAIRLRPILMTTLALICGMLPVALGVGAAGAEFRAPMAVTVIGGLVTSTLLTLVIVPVAYSILEGVKQRLSRSS